MYDELLHPNQRKEIIKFEVIREVKMGFNKMIPELSVLILIKQKIL